MQHFRSILWAAPLLAFSLSACGYDCGTVRQTVADGAIRDGAGIELATAEVELRETVGPSRLLLGAGVMELPQSMAGSLRGHVTRARLLTEGGELIAEIPTATELLAVNVIVALRMKSLSKAEYDRTRLALLGGRARVSLETDLPGRQFLEAVLVNSRDMGSSVQRCAPY